MYNNLTTICLIYYTLKLGRGAPKSLPYIKTLTIINCKDNGAHEDSSTNH